MLTGAVPDGENFGAVSESLRPVRIGRFQGYARSGFDLRLHWDSITGYIANGVPYYSMKDWRKVYRISLSPSSAIYVKDVDESRHEKRNFWRSMFSTEAARYYRNYRRMRRLGVATPPVLFVLGERRGLFWVRSLMATSELVGYLPWSDFFEAHLAAPQFNQLKDDVLKETACFAAKFHRLGYYLSLGGSNVFVRKNYDRALNNIALIDLDHIQRAIFGRMPDRRRKRNLQRFRETMKSTVGLSTADCETFDRYYDQF